VKTLILVAAMLASGTVFAQSADLNAQVVEMHGRKYAISKFKCKDPLLFEADPLGGGHAELYMVCNNEDWGHLVFTALPPHEELNKVLGAARTQAELNPIAETAAGYEEGRKSARPLLTICISELSY